MQDLSRFQLPPGFRGRSAAVVQIWSVMQSTFFRWSPQFAYGFRCWLLRCFGARIGKRVHIRPTATVTYPWKVVIDDYAWVGDHVVLYSLGEIEIGAHAVISQSSYLCTGSHDYSAVDFPIFAKKITVEPEAWVAADVFVGPGVRVGRGAVVGARSSLFSDAPPGMVCLGNPAKPVKRRAGQSQ